MKAVLPHYPPPSHLLGSNYRGGDGPGKVGRVRGAGRQPLMAPWGLSTLPRFQSVPQPGIWPHPLGQFPLGQLLGWMEVWLSSFSTAENSVSATLCQSAPPCCAAGGLCPRDLAWGRCARPLSRLDGRDANAAGGPAGAGLAGRRREQELASKAGKLSLPHRIGIGIVLLGGIALLCRWPGLRQGGKDMREKESDLGWKWYVRHL